MLYGRRAESDASDMGSCRADVQLVDEVDDTLLKLEPLIGPVARLVDEQN